MMNPAPCGGVGAELGSDITVLSRPTSPSSPRWRSRESAPTAPRRRWTGSWWWCMTSTERRRPGSSRWVQPGEPPPRPWRRRLPSKLPGPRGSCQRRRQDCGGGTDIPVPACRKALLFHIKETAHVPVLERRLWSPCMEQQENHKMGVWGDCPRSFATRLWKKAQRAWGWEGGASRAWKSVWACSELQASCPLRGFPKSFLPPWSCVPRVCVFPCASVESLRWGGECLKASPPRDREAGKCPQDTPQSQAL